MMKKKLAILDKNAHWWKDSPEITQWAIEDKDGTWWLGGGSEFPEKKKGKKPMKINKRTGEKSIITNPNFFLLVFVSGFLGISLAINLLFILGVL